MAQKRTPAKRRGTPAKRRSRTTSPDVIANQVFLGIPWRGTRPKYERLTDKLKTKWPLSFIIVGRSDSQDAEDLLGVITEKLRSSSYAIFDATGGNANVSLEYGYAEALDIQRALYVSTHGRATGATDAPIIADLAGKRRNHYKQEAGLSRLLTEFSKAHPYTIRFERFLTDIGKRASKGTKRRNRSLALKIVHTLDNVRLGRRADIVNRLQADPSRYTAEEVDAMLKKLHSAKLITSQQGPYARVQIS